MALPVAAVTIDERLPDRTTGKLLRTLVSPRNAVTAPVRVFRAHNPQKDRRQRLGSGDCARASMDRAFHIDIWIESGVETCGRSPGPLGYGWNRRACGPHADRERGFLVGFVGSD